VKNVLDFVADTDARMGLATSSHVRLIEAVMARLGIGDYFEVLVSAEFEPYGKPHPGVFLTAARQLDVKPQRCLVFEDSLRGVLAAKAAEMVCVCVPDPSLADDPRLAIADVVLPSLTAFNKDLWHTLNQ
jgi:sugar-phosphatase